MVELNKLMTYAVVIPAPIGIGINSGGNLLIVKDTLYGSPGHGVAIRFHSWPERSRTACPRMTGKENEIRSNA